jgi:D-glycero-D-manno-heptose 1,7-bisphosphate phosphatase
VNAPGPVSLVVLDRDGVINRDSSAYVKSADEWLPLPGSIDAIARLSRAGFTVAVASNQSGLARGLFGEAALNAMHAKLEDLVREAGGEIGKIAWCPHGPDEGCDCRKPRPGLLQTLARHYDTGLEGVPVIGDSLRDLEAALAVGARPILVRTGNGAMAETRLPDAFGTIEVYDDLSAATDVLINER